MEFDIDVSPLTGRIYAGIKTNNNGWSQKTDITKKACFVVALHVMEKFNGCVVTKDGEKCYEITVKEVKK